MISTIAWLPRLTTPNERDAVDVAQHHQDARPINTVLVPKAQAELVRRAWSYFEPDTSGFFCTGSRPLCKDLEGDKYTYLGWNEIVDPELARSVALLHVAPTIAQLRKGLLPNFVFDLPALNHLLFDLAFLNRLDTAFMSSLRSLTLSRSWHQPGFNTVSVSNPLGQFSMLTALRLIAHEEKEPLTFSLSHTNLPHLRYLSFTITNPDEVEALQGCTTLTDLDLTHVPSTIWASIGELPLVSLSLTGMTKTFSIEGLANLETVKFLWLNGCRAEVDCSIFRNMSHLTELDILNSKALRNVNELLACPKLKRLRVLDCGNPFRSSRSTFEQHGFEYLDISYA